MAPWDRAFKIQMQLQIWQEPRRVRELFRKASRGNYVMFYFYLFLYLSTSFLGGSGPLDNARTIPEWLRGGECF